MTAYFAADALADAASLLRTGGVLAYPTEAVFGLGCDPALRAACEKIFVLKKRPATQGMLLIGANLAMLEPYIDRDRVPSEVWPRILASWPGPVTWIFPASQRVPAWVAGRHQGIALRWTAHPPAAALCRAFGGAVVSTSANPHGRPPARTVTTLQSYFGPDLDGLLDAPLGDRNRPSEIRDALSGAQLRD